MADIDVVPKGRSSTRLWLIVAIIAVVLIAWWAMSRNRDASRTGSAAPGANPVHLADNGVPDGVQPALVRLTLA